MKPAPPAPDQLGPAIAYLAVKDGTPVYDRGGSRVGVVEHVMAVGGIFEGIIIHTPTRSPAATCMRTRGRSLSYGSAGCSCGWTGSSCTIRVVHRRGARGIGRSPASRHGSATHGTGSQTASEPSAMTDAAWDGGHRPSAVVARFPS
jgi:hypothetical protein